MMLFHSAAVPVLFGASVGAAVWAVRVQRSRVSRLAAWLSMLFAAVLVVRILYEGGSLHEGLAMLLPPLAILLPKEKRS